MQNALRLTDNEASVLAKVLAHHRDNRNGGKGCPPAPPFSFAPPLVKIKRSAKPGRRMSRLECIRALDVALGAGFSHFVK